jgi:hypothetical protein
MVLDGDGFDHGVEFPVDQASSAIDEHCRRFRTRPDADIITRPTMTR